MKPTDVRFNTLRKWRSLPKDALEELWSEGLRQDLTYFAERLGGREEKRLRIEKDDFPDLVAALNKRYDEGSSSLGEVIVSALHRRDSGDRAAAREQFERFHACCPSQCYREVAEQYIRELGG